MNNKSREVNISGAHEHKTQDSMERLKNDEVRNRNEVQQPALNGAEEVNRLVEGVASGTSPTESIERRRELLPGELFASIPMRYCEAICRAMLSRAATDGLAEHGVRGYCWLGIHQRLADALRNIVSAGLTETPVWAILVLEDGKRRIELRARLWVKTELHNNSVCVGSIRVEVQAEAHCAVVDEDIALATLAACAGEDDCASEAYVLLKIENDQCAVSGCFMADAITAYRSSELKMFRVSQPDGSLSEVPLSSKPMPGSSAMNSGLPGDDTKHFRKVGRINEGPDVQSNFLWRASQDEYIRDAQAEMAFALLNNLVWNGNPFRSCGPRGEDIYIQSVGANEPRQLVVNEQHRDSNIIALAVVDDDTVWFIGWTPVSDVKKREWMTNDDHNGRAYSVPAEALRSMDDLRIDESRQLMLFAAKPGGQA
jgi:hypothetical protein